MQMLDVDPQTEAAETVRLYNQTLPRFTLSFGRVTQVFNQYQDELHSIGPQERDLLQTFSEDELTALELVAILTAKIWETEEEDSKKLSSDLREQGFSLVDSLEQKLTIGKEKIERGLNEAGKIMDALIVDPVLTAPGHKFLEALKDC